MMLVKTVRLAIACGISATFLAVGPMAEAGLLSRFLPVVKPASITKDALPSPVVEMSTLQQSEEIPSPAAAGHVAQPCIVYRHKGPKLCCGDCRPPVQTVLRVKHPCVCCEVDVPVCIPACCTGEPTICADNGFLGRNVVEYEWCCGYSVRVAFRHKGDLLVTTWGR